MSLLEINHLFAYQWHTTNKLIESAEQLTADSYHENPGYGQGSIHDLFIHLLLALSGWRVSLETGKRQFSFDPKSCPDLPSIKKQFAQESAAWQTYLDRLTPEQFSGAVTLKNSNGDSYAFPQWQILHHLILHSMQHHSEIAQLLTAKEESPGDIDFIFYPTNNS